MEPNARCQGARREKPPGSTKWLTTRGCAGATIYAARQAAATPRSLDDDPQLDDSICKSIRLAVL